MQKPRHNRRWNRDGVGGGERIICISLIVEKEGNIRSGGLFAERKRTKRREILIILANG